MLNSVAGGRSHKVNIVIENDLRQGLAFMIMSQCYEE